MLDKNQNPFDSIAYLTSVPAGHNRNAVVIDFLAEFLTAQVRTPCSEVIVSGCVSGVLTAVNRI